MPRLAFPHLLLLQWCFLLLTACSSVDVSPLPTLAALALTPLPATQMPTQTIPPTMTAVTNTSVTPPATATVAITLTDCLPAPPRFEVITYTVQPGQGLFCLAQKFGVSATTLLYANLSQLSQAGGVATGAHLVIPPQDGAVYTVTTEDASNQTSLIDSLSRWYGLPGANTIVDWRGEPVSNPLLAGQQLFIPNADLLAGPFDSSLAAAQPLPNTSPSKNNLWTMNNEYDTGFCPLVIGEGWDGTLIWPVPGHNIHPGRSFRPGHAAIDIHADAGTSVVAVQGGIVVWAGYSTWGTGNMVILAHGEGWQTLYAHLSQVNVHCGEVIGQGETIGLSGQASNTDRPHLHFEVRREEYSYDPLYWLRQ